LSVASGSDVGFSLSSAGSVIISAVVAPIETGLFHDYSTCLISLHEFAIRLDSHRI
jgi:hypothetical protein